MPDDRRLDRRAPLAGVRATFEGATEQRQQAEVSNLSSGGLFLRVAGPLPVGKRLSLEIHAIGQAPWPALGRVVWARWLADDMGPPGMGVKLIDVEDSVSAAIAQLVERLAPPEPPVIPDAPPSRPRVPGAGTLPAPAGLLVAPLVQPSRTVVIEPHLPSREQLTAPNLAIDLVTKKPDSMRELPRERPVADEPWDDDELALPKTRWGKWFVLGLLLVAALGAGYAYRAHLRTQWLRVRALTKSAQADALAGPATGGSRA